MTLFFWIKFGFLALRKLESITKSVLTVSIKPGDKLGMCDVSSFLSVCARLSFKACDSAVSSCLLCSTVFINLFLSFVFFASLEHRAAVAWPKSLTKKLKCRLRCQVKMLNLALIELIYQLLLRTQVRPIN